MSDIMTLAEVRDAGKFATSCRCTECVDVARLAATVDRMVKFVRFSSKEPCRKYDWIALNRCGHCESCEARALLIELEA